MSSGSPVPSVKYGTRRALAALLVVLLGPALTAADDATAIAARIVASRATAATSAGDTTLGAELRSLADGLAAGRISLADAALVMQIAGANRTAAAPPSPAVAAASARTALAVLDGEPARAPKGAAAGAGVTPPAAAVAAAAPAVITDSTTSAATPLVLSKALSAIVLAVQADENNRAQLVMLSVGSDHGVTLGQRFRIRRTGQDLVLATVVQVKPRMSACTLLTNTWADGVDKIIKENDQAASPP